MDEPFSVSVAGVVGRMPIALFDELALADARRVLREKFPSILRPYLDSTQDDLDVIAAALELLPPYADPALRLTVHSVRSSSAQFGAGQLAATTH